MRILANENIPQKVIVKLRELGYEVRDLKKIGRQLTDVEVIGLAKETGETILTHDKDYLSLLESKAGEKMSLILIKIGRVTQEQLVGAVEFLHNKGYLQERMRVLLVSVDGEEVAVAKL